MPSPRLECLPAATARPTGARRRHGPRTPTGRAVAREAGVKDGQRPGPGDGAPGGAGTGAGHACAASDPTGAAVTAVGGRRVVVVDVDVATVASGPRLAGGTAGSAPTSHGAVVREQGADDDDDTEVLDRACAGSAAGTADTAGATRAAGAAGSTGRKAGPPPRQVDQIAPAGAALAALPAGTAPASGAAGASGRGVLTHRPAGQGQPALRRDQDGTAGCRPARPPATAGLAAASAAAGRRRSRVLGLPPRGAVHAAAAERTRRSAGSRRSGRAGDPAVDEVQVDEGQRTGDLEQARAALAVEGDVAAGRRSDGRRSRPGSRSARGTRSCRRTRSRSCRPRPPRRPGRRRCTSTAGARRPRRRSSERR